MTMLFGFEIYLREGGTEFVVVTAEALDDAVEALKCVAASCDAVGFSSTPQDVEQLIDYQYNGVASLGVI